MILTRAAVFIGALLVQATQAAVFTDPNLHANWDSPYSIVADNGVAIHPGNSRAFMTTRAGLLLEVPLRQGNGDVTRVYNPPVEAGLAKLCQSRPVLSGSDKAIYAVQDGSTRSRVFIVSTDTVPAPGAEGEVEVEIMTVDGQVKGTPIVKNGHIFVVHNVPDGNENRGKLSIFNMDTQELVKTLPEGDAADDMLDLAEPVSTSVTLPDGRVVEWLVLAQNIDDGSSNQGDLYGVRFDPQSGDAVWHTLARNLGSVENPPAVSSDGRTIVVGGFRNTVDAFVDSNDIQTAIESDTPLNLNIRTSWSVEVSRSDFPVIAQPTLFRDEYVIVSDITQNFVALNLQNRGRQEWSVDTFGRVESTALIFDDGTSDPVLYQMEEVGIVRQVDPTDGTINYQANCQGIIPDTEEDPFQVTDDNCAVVRASFALAPNGDYVVFASVDGSVDAFQVADFGTEPPTTSPSTSPTTGAPSSEPSLMPSVTPSTIPPTDVPSSQPSMNPAYSSAPSPLGGFTSSGDDDDDAGGNNGDDDDDDDSSIGGNADGFSGNAGDNPTEQEGLGVSDDTDEKNLNAEDDDRNADFIIVLLASVAAVLCCIVCVAFLCLQRRKDKEEEARIQEEVMVKKTWMSNKKAYEEEMRMEEQETLKALAPEGETLPPDEPEDDDSDQSPVEAHAAKEIAGSNFLRRQRNRGAKSQRGRWGMGAISENNDSEGEVLDSDIEEESGFEIALENMEGGKRNFDGEESTSMNSYANGNPSGGPVTIDESLTSDPILSPEALARATTPPTNGESDSHFNWFLQVLNIRAASTDRPAPTDSSSQLQTVEEESLAVSHFSEAPSDNEEPGEIRSPSRGWSGPPPPVVPDEPPSTPTRSYTTRGSYDSPTRTLSPGGDIPIVPKSPMSPSDVLSVDDSMYLDESTMSPHSSKYSPKSRAMKQPMSPPGGASVLSGMTTKSPMSKDDAEADDFFNKPYSTPGAHYLMPSLGARSARRVESNNDGPSRSPTRSPTAFQRPTRAAEEFDGSESARGATTFGGGSDAASSVRNSRAGLFSRRQRPVDKLMPQYESDASVSDVDSVDQHQKKQFEQKQQDALQLQKDVSQWRPDPASSPKTKPKDSAVEKKNSGSVWNSFLTELASAEEQFFNPKVSSSAHEGDSQSRGRSKELGASARIRDKSPDPPPAPPLDQSDDLSDDSPAIEQADSLDEDVPPPPPPMTYNRSDETPASSPPMTYQRSTSSEINQPKGLTYVRSTSTAWTNESNTDYY